MAQTGSSNWNRRSLIATVMLIGVISLLQPGCDCSSSGEFRPATIASVFPEQNSTTALVSTNVIVFFCIDMDETSINDTTFTLTETGGLQQTAVVTYDATTRTATLDPETDLVSGTQYTATVSATVQDAAGNTPLTNDFVWSFTVSQATELVSRDINGVTGNVDSEVSDIDESGRYIVFESLASNLVTNFVTNSRRHIYRKDTLTGEVLLVSSDSVGLEANDSSFTPRISNDGRFVVFASNATNLSLIFTGGTLQIYIKDMDDGSIDLVSRDVTGLVVADNTAENPDLTDDGRCIVFESSASNLSILNNNSFSQIFRKDMSDESIDMISRNTTQSAGGLGNSNRPDMGPDGRFIVFDSNAGNSIVSGANGTRHVYLVDMDNPAITEQISVDSSGLIQGDAASVNASVSDDGVFIAFESEATNLAASDTNGSLSDIFRRDRTTPGLTQLVSTPDNINSGDNASIGASISGDGTYVVFESASTNLVVESVSSWIDIFVRDFTTDPTVTIEKVNLSRSGSEATNNSSNASISSDGRYVTFDSPFAYDVTDTDIRNDVYRSYNSTF